MTTITWGQRGSTGWIHLHSPTGQTRVLKNGTTGLDAPPHTLETVRGLGVDGEWLSGWSYEPRTVTLAVLISARDRNQFLGVWQRLLDRLSPTRGPGDLRIVSDDGTDRSLTCSFVRGMEGDMSQDREGVTWWRGDLTFRAHSPFWETTATTTVTFQENARRPFFPIFPLRLNPNATFGSFIPGTDGDAPSWPTWTAYGPFTGFEVYNSAGERFQYAKEILPGGYVRVGFDPTNTIQEISRPADGINNVAPGIVWPSTMWPIRAGEQVGAAMDGTGEGSRLVLQYRTRWLSWRSAAPGTG